MKFKYTYEVIIKNCLNDLSLEVLDNYKFKNPKGTSELPYWDTNNYKSIYHFDENLNFDISEEKFTSCYKEENDKITYGKEQKCDV